MPWKATSVMEAKVQFISECLSGEEPMAVVCERYGISRETGYLWKRRFELEGAKGLQERSRAPHHHGRATPAELVVELIEVAQRLGVFISEALIGEPVGISERDDGHWLVRFADVPLALIDRYTAKLTRFGPGRPPRPEAKPDKTVRHVSGQ